MLGDRGDNGVLTTLLCGVEGADGVETPGWKELALMGGGGR